MNQGLSPERTYPIVCEEAQEVGLLHKQSGLSLLAIASLTCHFRVGHSHNLENEQVNEVILRALLGALPD